MLSRLPKLFYRFSTSYHPLKKLDFSSSPFQPIYKNSLETEIPKIVQKSFFINFTPFTIYSLSYLMFLTSSFTSLGIGGVLGMAGLINFCRKFNEIGRFVQKMEIDAKGETLKVFYGFWDEKVEERGRKMNLNVVDRQRGVVFLPIREIKSIKFMKEEKNRLENELEEELKTNKSEKEEEANKIKKKQKQEEDILEIIIERNNQDFEIFLFIEHNAIPAYNDYLTALGRGQKLVLT